LRKFPGLAVFIGEKISFLSEPPAHSGP
jgi:hypothetical protein